MKALDMKIQDALKQAKDSRDDKANFVKETHGEGESDDFSTGYVGFMTLLAVLSSLLIFSGLVPVGA